MSDVDRLLADYIAEHRAGGEADPGTYLARASAAERAELAALIDAYLARAPRQPFDQAALPRLDRGAHRRRARTGDRRAGRALARPAAAGYVTVPGSSAARSSIGSRRPLGSRTGARRSPATTTRWSRACCPPRAYLTGCSRRSGGSSAKPHRHSETPDGHSRPPARGPPRRRPRSPAAPTPNQPAPRRPGTQPPPSGEWDEVDELFRGA